MRVVLSLSLLLSIAPSAFAATPATQPAAAEIRVTPATWPNLRNQVRPGDTVVFADGDYPPIEISPTISGASSPTTFRAANPWRAVIRHAAYYGIYTSTASNLLIEGFAIEQPRGSGMKFAGASITVRRCLITGAGLSGIEAQNCSNMVYEANVIQFNGQNPKHHGLYLTGGPQMVRGCIIRNNAGNGIASIPFRLTVEECLIVQNHRGIWLNAGASLTTIRRNTIADNRWAQIEATGASYATDVQVNVERNVLCGKFEIRTSGVSPTIKLLNNLMVDVDFFPGRERGDYRAADTGFGWPAARQWTSQQGWDEGVQAIPFRFDPRAPQPTSLMPGG